MNRIQPENQNPHAVNETMAACQTQNTHSTTLGAVPGTRVQHRRSTLKRSSGHAVCLTAISLLAGFSHTSFAVNFTGIASGAWLNPEAEPRDVWSIHNNDLGGGIARFSFGAPPPPTDPKSPAPTAVSELLFDGIGSDLDPAWSGAPNVPFRVGNLVYYNENTIASSTVKGVDLSVNVKIVSPIGLATDFLFDFKIQVTSNKKDPVASTDIVSVSHSFSPTAFQYAGVDYSLQLLGFSSDGGITLRTDFTTREGARSDARLYAVIREETSSVPDTGMTLSMMGMGLVGLGVSRRWFQAD